MRLRMLVLTCCAALGLGGAAIASAAAPVISDQDIPLHSLGVDPFLSEVCGFDVEVLNQGRIQTIEYSDGSSQSHHQDTFYWRANGRSLTERTSFTISDDGEALTFRGTVFHLVVPGRGPALVEAGLAVFGPGGEIVRLAGLHQVLEGTGNPQAVCDYLAAA
jgi:hypothetical protein